jgi:hypothetical protein
MLTSSPSPIPNRRRLETFKARSTRTRAGLVAACRKFMQSGDFRPSVEACCDAVGRSRPTAYKLFGSAEALRLEAACDPSTREAIVGRVLGCERTALSAETLDRLVRALVTGIG